MRRTIQPFNRLTVETHRRDELAHGSIFKGLAKSLYGSLTAHEREFFIEVLPRPVHWFANMELDVWQAMLRQIDFPATDRMIGDCRSANEENLARTRLFRIDHSGRGTGHVRDAQRSRELCQGRPGALERGEPLCDKP